MKRQIEFQVQRGIAGGAHFCGELAHVFRDWNRGNVAQKFRRGPLNDARYEQMLAVLAETGDRSFDSRQFQAEYGA